ncbi:unnamed protein product [Chrysoparadoxa australica]
MEIEGQPPWVLVALAVFAALILTWGVLGDERRAERVANSDRTGGAPKKMKPLTESSRLVLKQLSVPRAAVVTVLGNEVLFRRSDDEGWTLQPQAKSALLSIADVCDVRLLCLVESDKEQEAILTLLSLEGITGNLLPPHRVLFCSTRVGVMAMVRQLRPMLHVDVDAGMLFDLVRHVAHLVLISSGAVNAVKALAKQGSGTWRELESLSQLCH